MVVLVVNEGDKIAQLIIEQVALPEVVEVDEIDDTVRGEGGFGSTGVQAPQVAESNGNGCKRKRADREEEKRGDAVEKEQQKEEEELHNEAETTTVKKARVDE